ncbi:DUF192 domain-containing protein [Natronorubrum daqingense]|uniref:DUF192 domain-containing protein n=1 Tax=Natronorubrum daqingense TaxID=588898 RepID=A0A1N7CPP3_9EURY|nr:DUF192 domain-containing protein [Natronorubrum daqingense]APX98215.1 hypothetical protein BB347_10395 [Natronorubrum daqingense]SIR65467.1 hypothetical protein SAMN05421809_1810 [Natronorubrum daqingense]
MISERSATADRRTMLAGLAATFGSVGLAGCTGGDEDDDDDNGDEPTENSNSNDDEAEDLDSNDDETVHSEYESTDVLVTTSDGDELGEVTAAIADTPESQELGLSDTDTLPDDRGMLFVYDTIEDRTFAMPEMSFGIDIVFADDEGVITSIFHAPEPEPDEDGSEQTYSGSGQYVLEVVYEWTAENDIEEGDVLNFEL